MTGAQATGAGIGAIAGGVLSAALNRYTGYQLSTYDASTLTVSAIAVGGAIAHALVTYGVTGLGRIVWLGLERAGFAACSASPRPSSPPELRPTASPSAGPDGEPAPAAAPELGS